MRITHQLNRGLRVWRAQLVDDGAGGHTTTMLPAGQVWARVSQPTTTEKVTAQAAGVDLDHKVYLEPDADVCRGDELRGDGQVLVVVDVTATSRRDHQRADCRLRQARES